MFEPVSTNSFVYLFGKRTAYNSDVSNSYKLEPKKGHKKLHQERLQYN